MPSDIIIHDNRFTNRVSATDYTKGISTINFKTNIVSPGPGELMPGIILIRTGPVTKIPLYINDISNREIDKLRSIGFVECSIRIICEVRNTFIFIRGICNVLW